MRKTKKKIAVFLANRSNYGRLKPVMKVLAAENNIELQVVCTGTMLLGKYGTAKNVVTADGFKIDEEVFMEVEGSVLNTMAKSIGLGIIEFSGVFKKLNPDFVLLVGDRYEALSASIAAVYQNICLIHIQGGEVTGSIDESARHAITKLAHYHFPATKRAGNNVMAMGEDPKTVFSFGCPCADVVSEIDKKISPKMVEDLGVGKKIDFSKEYLLVLFHPVTTEFGEGEEQMQALLEAVAKINKQVIMLWPNIDAGSVGVSRAIRKFREANKNFPLHVYKNFPPEVYIPLMNSAVCLVGNSSSFIRDASFLATPVVLVGSRQDGREWSEAVKRVATKKEDIIIAIREQIKHGPYSPCNIYGKPGVSKKIGDAIVKFKPYKQKKYFDRESS
jgi:UDP-hydrolysing UDP-N-acetyl-D-glucosamine 2-epimerase